MATLEHEQLSGKMPVTYDTPAVSEKFATEPVEVRACQPHPVKAGPEPINLDGCLSLLGLPLNSAAPDQAAEP